MIGTALIYIQPGGTVISMETLMKATLVKNSVCGLLEPRYTINIYKLRVFHIFSF